MKIADIAFVTHEVNRAFCRAIGDNSQLPYESAPDWQKKSAEEGVQAIINGRVKKPEDSHASWMEAKLKDGWTWGEVKDPEKKRHPCLVPYTSLPLEQRLKDHLFFNTVTTLLALHISRKNESA